MGKGWLKIFENVGQKIKRFAIGFVIVEALAAIIVGVLMAGYKDTLLWGLLLIFLAPFAGLPIGWFIYGYGQMIENSDKLVQCLTKKDINSTEYYLNKTKTDASVETDKQYIDSTDYYLAQSRSEKFIVPINSVSIFREYFKNNNELTCAKIPPNVKTINVEAFCNCSNLKTVYLPKGIHYIGQGTFKGCAALTDVYYSGSEEEWAKIQIGDYNEPLLNAQIHYDYK